MQHFANLIDNGLITAFHRIISADDYRAISAELDNGAPGVFEKLNARYPSGLVDVVNAIKRAVARKKGES